MKSRDPVTLSRTSTLGYALLGLLARGERSGYDLTQGLKLPVGFFWHAGHSQVYPELARLEAAELIQHTVVAQAERPDKKVYRLTATGDAALVAWLSDETEVPKIRDELLLKTYTIWRADRAAALHLIRRHAAAHRTQQKAFEQLLQNLRIREGAALDYLDDPWFGAQATLRRGIGYEREYAEWCEWLAGVLEQPV